MVPSRTPFETLFTSLEMELKLRVHLRDARHNTVTVPVGHIIDITSHRKTEKWLQHEYCGLTMNDRLEVERFSTIHHTRADRSSRKDSPACVSG